MASDVIESWHTWRKTRTEKLKNPHGWLSLTSFTWLGRDECTLPDFPGTWCVEGEQFGVVSAVAHFDNNDVVTYQGAPSGKAISFILAEDESDNGLCAGDVQAEVGIRGGKYMVRVRDPKSEILANFQGVPVYDYNEAARVPAMFYPYARPRRVSVDTAMEGITATAELVGEVEFEFSGVPTRLGVRFATDSDKSNRLTVVFHDATNWKETAGWRFVNFDAPEEALNVARAGRYASGDDGEGFEVVIDFNFAANFPSAFTPFVACPRPPAGNTVSAAVRAGEKSPV